ncbi:hypothetical protein QA646_08735 [Rhizobium sp. CB3090]|uniref:hypothetical protein n=1 Tax=Rhizobium sp. CB3090 TaxID=3039156 RepID=UPI0024B0E863|nr:hypothetical protein [Rhizobium sp. CB3090]WFU10908.1 hypothetical protein QA646_08735 [Rhizobium sp. CB3090]
MNTAVAQTEEREIDPVEAALALCGGDARATIVTLLEELHFVRKQLALTQAGMSVGFTRGWKPSFEIEGE